MGWYAGNPTPTQQSPQLNFDCTAQFITPNVLLTAGHCLKDFETPPARGTI